MNNKRGISPLIATVLLVAFSIILAALVSTFIINRAKEFNPNVLAEDSVFCESVSLGYKVDKIDIVKFGLYPALGSNPLRQGETLSATTNLFGPLNLTNKGTFSIHQLIISAGGNQSKTVPIIILGTGGAPTIGTIPPSQGYSTYIQLNSLTNSQIQLNSLTNSQIKIVPVINDTEKNQFVKCITKPLIFDYKQLCRDVKPGVASTQTTPTYSQGCPQ